MLLFLSLQSALETSLASQIMTAHQPSLRVHLNLDCPAIIRTPFYQVVGVNTLKATGDGIGFAIPIDTAWAVITQV
jgi:hypothetical protein